jgi:kumamolisin
MPMRLVVHLAYPNPAAVDSFVRTVNDPASPMFGHYLTPMQFASAFGPSQGSYAAVIGRLRSAGFRIAGEYSNRKVIDVVSDAAHAQAFFGTTIGHVTLGGATYYANLTPARIPFALRGAVRSVSGFNNYSRMRSYLTRTNRTTQPFNATTNPGPYGPKDIQTAYNEAVHVNPAINGTSSTGVHATIAIETAFDYQDSDLAGFWTMSGVTRAPGAYVYRKFVDNPSGQGIFNPAESTETTADVEQTTSNAPGANVLVVEGVDNLTSTFDDVYAATVTDPRVDIVTTSWGLCEINEDQNEVLSDSDLFKQGAAEGQTMFAASGDSGSKDCTDSTNQSVIGVDFPSSSPWVGASGGTSMLLNSDDSINTDTGWSGSGGGVSVIFPLPSYQTPVSTLAARTGRNSPDVALLADNTTGYTFYYLGSGTTLKIGGTSLVAPNMAADYAQYDGFFNKRLGLAQTGLYKMFATKKYPGNVFYDILTGSNGDYSCHAGYDNVTGPGSFNGYLYMTKVVPHSGSTPL